QARFMAEGVEGLTRDKTRKPGKQPLPTSTVQRVVDLTLGPPPGDATHWTGRMLAKAVGVSLRSVQRILEAHQLAPHRIRTFKLSTDPKFAEKLNSTMTRLSDATRTQCSFSTSDHLAHSVNEAAPCASDGIARL